MTDLFGNLGAGRVSKGPLADRMRPTALDEIVGQEALVGAGTSLRQLIDSGEVPSMILWGPPGSGKTTIAMAAAKASGLDFVRFSAVTSGIKEVREVIESARRQRSLGRKSVILFIDEIHRFNRSQQDAFLPHIEDGTIVLIGATTENPSFELNAALLSRCRVYTLRRLTDEELRALARRAIDDTEKGLGKYRLKIADDVLGVVCSLANGDARDMLNLLESSALAAPPSATGGREITATRVREVAQRKVLRYDRDREEHYNIISALHKSMRGSDPDAALYWLARMLEAGEDPLYVARRMVRFASEDVGNADPQALVIAVAAKDAVDFLGMPEANTALAQAAVYLATAPKSNAVYVAYGAAARAAEEGGNLPVPMHIRNAVTDLMKNLDYGKGYQYAHDLPDAVDTQECLPPELKGKVFYRPTDRGFEGEIGKRMDERRRRRRERGANDA